MYIIQHSLKLVPATNSTLNFKVEPPKACKVFWLCLGHSHWCPWQLVKEAAFACWPWVCLHPLLSSRRRNRSRSRSRSPEHSRSSKEGTKERRRETEQEPAQVPPQIIEGEESKTATTSTAWFISGIFCSSFLYVWMYLSLLKLS